MLNGVWNRRKYAFVIQLPTLSEYLHRLTSRFFLNLRSIAFHQQQTTVGTHPIPSTFSPVRTRPTWKKSGRTMTDFFVLSVDKATNNHETDTNEWAIQQAEAFDLEVVKTQKEEHNLGIQNDVER
jgi:hypothetical protein